jgi:CheY-like chemotaxis protein
MIIGLVDVVTETPDIYDPPLPPPLLEDLEIVRRNCEHLASMINDVLDLSQTEAGRLTLHRGWVDIREELNQAITVVRPLLEKKKLYLKLAIPPELPDIFCDRTRIRQVILNLLSNAARYTDQGGVTLQVAQGGEDVVVEIIDTGPGINPEEALRIFEPFYQAGDDVWREKGGSGLGLSISKQFIERHGGKIWFESEPGRGSTFAFRLPISPLPPPAAGAKRWINENWLWYERTAWPNLPKLPYQPRLVVCDETANLQHLLGHYADEIEFVYTTSLAQTLAALESCPAHAVIVNAATVGRARRFMKRARLEIQTTPIIGCALPPRIDRALAAGAINYLIKPIARVDLGQALEKLPNPVRTVLIADDDPDVRNLLSRMLATFDTGIKVYTAATGKEALSQLRACSPDVMLLDVVMPDLDGWQVLAQKGKEEAIRAIPVIIVSAQDPREQPVHSDLLLATFGSGISIPKVLRSSLELSALFMKADEELDPVPE